MTDKGTQYTLLSVATAHYLQEFGTDILLWLHLHYKSKPPLFHIFLINVTMNRNVIMTKSEMKCHTLLVLYFNISMCPLKLQ